MTMKTAVLHLSMSALMAAFLFFCFPAQAASIRIDPTYEVSADTTHLLEIARGEIGYTEGAHGYTKYGEWAGDPYAQWCAEFLCWCVSQTDEQYGTQLLETVYPLYSSSNVGRNWFIDHGRYVVRWGNLEGWGYQWLKGEDMFLTTGSYIPQPGDWVFFTWTSDLDTDHVAMVEYCTSETDGSVTIHVIEGNTPSSVKRATYPLTYGRILGFGTVHDVADWTMRSGNVGEKVRQLQDKLAKIGYLTDQHVDGRFGPTTQGAVMAFQSDNGIRANGIANITTQKELDRQYRSAVNADPSTWRVDDACDDELTLDFDSLFSELETDEEELSIGVADVFLSDPYDLSNGSVAATEDDLAVLSPDALSDDIPGWVTEDLP